MIKKAKPNQDGTSIKFEKIKKQMLRAKYQSEKTLTAHIFGLVFWTDIQSTFLEIFGQRPLSLKIPNVKVFDITVPPAQNVC